MAKCDVSVIQNALGIQQTGPRTVIVPADPIIWSAGTSYEYLTLVTSTDFGQAYISKRDVPAGTPLTNAEYWIPAAQYNAQLAQIQTNISGINAQLTTLADDVANLKNDVSSGETFAIYLGNSWTAGIGSTGNNNGLFARTKNMFTDAVMRTTSGGSITTFQQHTESFQTLLNEAIVDPSIDNSKVTHVICMCTIGEANNYSLNPDTYYATTVSALQDMRTAAMGAFPKLKRLIVVNCEARRDYTIANGGGISGHTTDIVSTIQLDALLRQACKRSYWEYGGWAGSSIICQSGCFGDDNIHPVDTGYATLAASVRQAIACTCVTTPLTFYGRMKDVYTGTNNNIYCQYADGKFTVKSLITRVTASVALPIGSTVHVLLPCLPGVITRFDPPTYIAYNIEIYNPSKEKRVILVPQSYDVDASTGLLDVTCATAGGSLEADDLVGYNVTISLQDQSNMSNLTNFTFS